MPRNEKIVQPWTEDRHIDLQADLHFFCDWLLVGKTILDVGAGLGKSKVRMRHNRVQTYEPSPACRHLVDYGANEPLPRLQVTTAFEVIEHVEDDIGFLRMLDDLSTEAVVLSTPNWNVSRCESVNHYREYVAAELRATLREVWPHAALSFFAYHKDAEGGWVGYPKADRLTLKHVVLVNKALPPSDSDRAARLMAGR